MFPLTSFVVALYVLSISGSAYGMDEISRGLLAGKCRSTCLTEYIRRLEMDHCWSAPMHYCHMCWDYCHMLSLVEEELRSVMCNDDICYDGCKFACNFFKNYYRRSKKFQENAYEISNIEMINSSISWIDSPASKSNSTTVFAIFGKKVDEEWNEIDQFAVGKPDMTNENITYSKISIYSITRKNEVARYFEKEPNHTILPEEIIITAWLDIDENKNHAHKQEASALYIVHWIIFLMMLLHFN